MLLMQSVDVLSNWPAWTKILLDQRITNAVIALATLVNVLVAAYIGDKAKKAAEAAKQSADAAKRSADVGAKEAEISNAVYEASHRPYFAVTKIEAIEFHTPLDALCTCYSSEPWINSSSIQFSKNNNDGVRAWQRPKIHSVL
jgi:hypothetical protein